MKKINFCIILYNKKISESKTIVSLVNYFKKETMLGNIIVFNNGPTIVEHEYSEYIILNQVLVNTSLSKIYNKFISEYSADYYVFLDDDTTLDDEYLNELRLNSEDIIFPKISCNGKEHYPLVNNNKIQSITSGLVLSKNFCEELITKNQTVFDERFDLYGIDTAFCYMINNKRMHYSISNTTIEHDLSHISLGNNDFREIEVLLANSASIIPYFSFRLLLTVGYGQIKMIKKLKFKVLISSFFSIILKRTIRIWRF
jgi:hypothetical protein